MNSSFFFFNNFYILFLNIVKITLHYNIVTLRSKNKDNAFKAKFNLLN